MPADDAFRIDGASPRLVRQYTLTAGRTAPSVDLPMEATIELVSRTAGGHLDESDLRADILEFCSTEPSIAEVSAKFDIALGVTRVLVSDLISLGKVRVSALTLTDTSNDDERRDLIERTLSGLRNL